MNVKSFNQLTDKQKLNFFNWLRDQSNDDPAYENMWADNWQDQPNTVPYILTNTQKYSSINGDFNIVYDKKTIAGCAAVYIAPFNNKIALAGVRTWITPEYRNKLIAREYLLPAHKQWAINNKCHTVALTFNDYNKNLRTIWRKRRLGENRSVREPHHMFYSNFNELEYPVLIQQTPQWVIYEQLSDSYFNWQMIQVQG